MSVCINLDRVGTNRLRRKPRVTGVVVDGRTLYSERPTRDERRVLPDEATQTEAKRLAEESLWPARHDEMISALRALSNKLKGDVSYDRDAETVEQQGHCGQYEVRDEYGPRSDARDETDQHCSDGQQG